MVQSRLILLQLESQAGDFLLKSFQFMHEREDKQYSAERKCNLALSNNKSEIHGETQEEARPVRLPVTQ